MKKIIFILIIFGFVFLGGFYFFYQYKINSGAGAATEDILFTIASGEGVKQIAQNLADENLISSKAFFLHYVRSQKKEAGFQAGEYFLNPGLPMKKIISILTEGKAVSREKTIKIIEGWRISNINDYLTNENILSKDEFSRLAKTKISLWPFSFAKQSFVEELPNSADLEGFLFPDTYRIFEDADSEAIIKKMLDNFETKLSAEMRADIASQGRTIYEVITMAAIIEKEVRAYADMQIVSGLFWNRIKYGQPLESCATLAYILGEDKPQYTLADTEIDSPYNTYRNQGLPPGPIANPGLNAIKAAIYPKDTEYNYFLSASASGETIFSKTYDEHLRNKAKYLR